MSTRIPWSNGKAQACKALSYQFNSDRNLQRKGVVVLNIILSKDNLEQYIVDTYGNNYNYFFKCGEHLLNIKPLIQAEYGEDNDCTLVSILTILNYRIGNLNLNYWYSIIERVAKKYFYTGQTGTLPFFINSIMKRVTPEYNSYVRYLKNIGFNFNTIKRQLDRDNPVIISMMNDGRNVYKNHSIVVIGYNMYKIDNRNIRILAVYDNWSREVRYIDYERLSMISSINYYAPIAQLDRAQDF